MVFLLPGLTIRLWRDEDGGFIRSCRQRLEKVVILIAHGLGGAANPVRRVKQAIGLALVVVGRNIDDVRAILIGALDPLLAVGHRRGLVAAGASNRGIAGKQWAAASGAALRSSSASASAAGLGASSATARAAAGRLPAVHLACRTHHSAARSRRAACLVGAACGSGGAASLLATAGQRCAPGRAATARRRQVGVGIDGTRGDR